MGKRSVKENKNIYQLSREAKELSREAASELLEYISPERIEKIESGKSMPHPDEVLTMEEQYENPELCNYYCTNECPIGMKYVPKARLSDFSQVTIDIIASLNALSEEKDRMIAIAREESAPEIAAYWQANALSIPYSPQSDRRIFSLFASSTIPRVYICSPSGIVEWIGIEDFTIVY